jgi:hypothetical protein
LEIFLKFWLLSCRVRRFPPTARTHARPTRPTPARQLEHRSPSIATKKVQLLLTSYIMSHGQDVDRMEAVQMVAPAGEPGLLEYDPSYKFDVGCCGSRKLHTVKLKPKLGFINIKKKHGFCLCCMRQTNGSALVKNIKSVEIMSPQKSIVVAYLLWLLLGIVGGHRFYTGRWRTGLLWMITLDDNVRIDGNRLAYRCLPNSRMDRILLCAHQRGWPPTHRRL